MKRLIRKANPITHREIPMQIGLNMNTYETMLINNSEIETHSKNVNIYPDYTFNHDIDNMEWRLRDMP